MEDKITEKSSNKSRQEKVAASSSMKKILSVDGKEKTVENPNIGTINLNRIKSPKDANKFKIRNISKMHKDNDIRNNHNFSISNSKETKKVNIIYKSKDLKAVPDYTSSEILKKQIINKSTKPATNVIKSLELCSDTKASRIKISSKVLDEKELVNSNIRLIKNPIEEIKKQDKFNRNKYHY